MFPAGQSAIAVGKLQDHPIHLNGELVSRNHCRLERRGEGWRIVDQGSRNGLFVNGGRVAEHDLRPGDVIKVGEYELEYLQPAGRTKRAADGASIELASQVDGLQALAIRDENADDGMMYRLVEEIQTAPKKEIEETKPVEPGPTCPSCRRELRRGAKICVQCGVDIRTGRAILISQESNLNEIYAAAETLIAGLSWLIWVGIYPIASEAFGKRKPWTVRSIAILTILVSGWFSVHEWTDSPKMWSLKNLMLWCGEAKPEGEMIAFYYTVTNWGNSEAYFQKVDELQAGEDPAAQWPDQAAEEMPEEAPPDVAPQLLEEVDDELAAEAFADEPLDPADESAIPATAVNASGDAAATATPLGPSANGTGTSPEPAEKDVYVSAHEALPPEERALGEYRPTQLVTHALLHGGLLHLAGNLLFLMVLGTRVNALIGNLAAAVLYPLLAIGSGLVHMWSAAAEMPRPLLGASGAIMGLAGMYLVLFPANKVHMASWVRMVPVFNFSLRLNLFAMRGFWVVAFYIAFDIFYTVFGIEDGTAHWAHLGGFIMGAAIALVLLSARLVNARGGDLLSVILGKHAWALVGRPDIDRKALLGG